MSTMRGLAAGVALTLVTGCLEPAASICDNGGACPPGLKCASNSSGTFCVPASCGNRVVEDGERCDDGNFVDGDGCSHDCASPETCGTGVVDLGEACDDGNLSSHDGCSSACKVESDVWATDEDAPAPRSQASLVFDRLRGTLMAVGGQRTAVLSDTDLSDFWEWDGAVWRQRNPRTTPGPVGFSVTAYDSARERIVLFNGYMWEWDGRDWTQIANGTARGFEIAGGEFGAMAYDSKRARLVDLVGNQTWAYYEATGWVPLHPVHFPPTRGGARMVYDTARDRLVLFGGVSMAPGAPVTFADTWQFDGTDWVQTSSGSVPARTLHGMAYDEQRGVVVMAGGISETGSFLRDSWELDATSTWHAGPQLPEERGGLALAYDTVRGHVLAFGGQYATLTPGATGKLSDLLAYDGARWTRLTAMREGLPLEEHGSSIYSAQASLFFDPVRDELVDYSTTRRTWHFDQGQWSLRPDDAEPTAIEGFSTVAVGDKWLMVGGGVSTNLAPLSETWLYSAAAGWVKQSTAAAPALRNALLAYDPIRDRVVMFSGDAWPAGEPNETWEWTAAAGWSKQSPTTVPVWNSAGAMAFDPVRQTVILYRSVYPGTPDMWEWNGTNWSAVTATGAPNVGAGALVTDSGRQRMVMFTSMYGDAAGKTWEWNGSAWSLKAPVHSPPALFPVAGAYDSVAGRVVLYGTTDIGARAMWTWNGTDWTEAPLTHVKPSPRSGHAMAYDAAREEIVVFGGSGFGVDDTWTWSRAGWHKHDVTIRPLVNVGPGAYVGTCAYDQARERVVFVTADETWEWDGTQWDNRTPAGDKPHTAIAMAYDTNRQRMLVLAVNPTSQPGAGGSTWAWDGTSWIDLGRYPGSPDVAFAFDPALDVAVAFGGSDGTETGLFKDATYVWDGTSWTEHHFASGPAARRAASAIYDPARRRIVLLGGEGSGGVLDDGWEWTGSAWQPLDAKGPATEHAGIAIDPASGSVVVFGGATAFTGSSASNALWFLRKQDPAYRDEVCRSGSGDIDGDGASECDDPDCALVCAP